MRFRKPYDEAAHIAAAQASVPDFSGDRGMSLTSQSAANELDINAVVRRYGITTDLHPAAVRELVAQLSPGSAGQYADVGLDMSYHEALTRLKNAEATFMELPAGIRSKFRNQPAELLDALAAASVGDEEALARLVDAGVVDEPPAKPAVPAPAAAAPAVDTSTAPKA